MNAREVREAASIDDVLAWYGYEPPSRSSWHTTWFSVRCPFHDDSVASASVDYDDDVFVCHACGIKGDVVHVVMGAQGIGYQEAVRWIELNVVSSTEGSTSESSTGWV